MIQCNKCKNELARTINTARTTLGELMEFYENTGWKVSVDYDNGTVIFQCPDHNANA